MTSFGVDLSSRRLAENDARHQASSRGSEPEAAQETFRSARVGKRLFRLAGSDRERHGERETRCEDGELLFLGNDVGVYFVVVHPRC
jgi:hypothetical protein